MFFSHLHNGRHAKKNIEIFANVTVQVRLYTINIDVPVVHMHIYILEYLPCTLLPGLPDSLYSE